MNLPLKLSSEMIAILMIGEGALALTQPSRHVGLWNAGPQPWRAFCTFFEARPTLTMALGAASIALGFWLASGLRREEEDVYDHLGAEAHVPSTAWEDFDAVVH
jgi:hypothetical protein